MRPILLATDGSPSAAEATREAIELARVLDTTLVAVAVEHVGIPIYGYYGYAEVYTELHRTAREHVRTLLDEVAARCAEAGVPCEVFAPESPVAEAICRIAREQDAGMIVIGAHGWGAIRRLAFGSVSLAVLTNAPCPVLVARGVPDGETTWVDDRRVTAAVV
jgi:nucleotide-binding universal stress UspA family protein